MKSKVCIKYRMYVASVILVLSLGFCVGCGQDDVTSHQTVKEFINKASSQSAMDFVNELLHGEATVTPNQQAKESLNEILLDEILAAEEVQEAYALVMQLKENEDAEADLYFEKMKYAMYQEDVYKIEDEYTLAYDAESAEAVDSLLQGEWYVVGTENGVEVTPSTINGKEYFIVSAYGGENYYIVFGFFDEPEVWYEASLYTKMHNFYDKNGVFDMAKVSYLEFFKNEWSQSFNTVLYKNDAELERCLQSGYDIDFETGQSDSKQHFSKEDVYAKAKADFIEIYEDRYSLLDLMYMSVKYESVSEASFSYDEDMDEYNIRFKISIYELGQMFDEIYVLRATYTTNSYGDLEVVSFNLE